MTVTTSDIPKGNKTMETFIVKLPDQDGKLWTEEAMACNEDDALAVISDRFDIPVENLSIYGKLWFCKRTGENYLVSTLSQSQRHLYKTMLERSKNYNAN